jgi:hypothetical protein
MFPCPQCGGDTRGRFIGKEYYAMCDRCRVCWWEGHGIITNPFLEEETEADRERTRQILRQYTLIGTRAID